VLILLRVLAYAQVAQPSSKTSEYSLTQTGMISLPDLPGRLDHMAFSMGLKLLVFAARANNSIAVANTTSMKLDRIISGFNLPNWVARVNQDRALVVTNGGNGTVSIIDPRSFADLAKVDLPF
jgi:DNA-binding beta-propeller fold protein YncE